MKCVELHSTHCHMYVTEVASVSQSPEVSLAPEQYILIPEVKQIHAEEDANTYVFKGKKCFPLYTIKNNPSGHFQFYIYIYIYIYIYVYL